MDRLRDVTARRALILLGAFIVVGGFVLALLPGANFGQYGSFSGPSLGPARQQDVVVGQVNPPSGAWTFFAEGVPPGTYPVPGSTQVVRSTTVSSTTSGYGGNPAQGGTGGTSAANGTGGTAPGTGSLLEFSSTITLQSAAPQSTASGVVALAYSVGGYVAYQSTYRDAAFVVVRVPASQYQQTLTGVEALGMVIGLVSNSNDVRVQYTDLNATLASLRTEQGALLRLLNQSTTINSTLAIEKQLQEVNQQINNIESQILQTRTLIDYATISVTISESAQNSPLSIVLKSAPQNGTAPFSVTFNAVVKGGAQPYFVTYNIGDGSADQGQILIHTYYQSGDFKVTVTATDQNGTVAIAATKVHVEAAPGQIGVNDFFGTVANLFVSVVEGIVEVAVVVLPLAAVGAVVLVPLRRRGKAQKDIKQNQ